MKNNVQFLYGLKERILRTKKMALQPSEKERFFISFLLCRKRNDWFTKTKRWVREARGNWVRKTSWWIFINIAIWREKGAAVGWHICSPSTIQTSKAPLVHNSWARNCSDHNYGHYSIPTMAHYVPETTEIWYFTYLVMPYNERRRRGLTANVRKPFFKHFGGKMRWEAKRG